MALFSFDKTKSKSETVISPVENLAFKSDESNETSSGPGALVIKDILANLQQNQSIHYATAGHWNSHELLEQLLQKTGPAKIYFTTWAMSENPVRSILNLIDQGLITELNCVFDLKVQDRAPKVFQLIERITTRVRLVHCHAKVFVIQNDQWGVSNNGSANWTRNPRMEAGVLSTDPKIAEFHKGWIMRLIENNNATES